MGGMRGMYAAPRAQKNTLTLPPGSAEQLAAFRSELASDGSLEEWLRRSLAETVLPPGLLAAVTVFPG